jgi:hypothetical protein
LCQARAKSRVKAIAEARDFVDVWPALAVCFVQGTLKLGNISREGVVALLESIELILSFRPFVWIVVYS